MESRPNQTEVTTSFVCRHGISAIAESSENKLMVETFSAFSKRVRKKDSANSALNERRLIQRFVAYTRAGTKIEENLTEKTGGSPLFILLIFLYITTQVTIRPERQIVGPLGEEEDGKPAFYSQHFLQFFVLIPNAGTDKRKSELERAYKIAIFLRLGATADL